MDYMEAWLEDAEITKRRMREEAIGRAREFA